MIKYNKYIKIIFRAFLVLIVVLLHHSCKKTDPTDCFKSTGEDITETRNSGVFNKIVLYDNVNLYLTQAATNTIEVTAGKKVMKKINTSISGGKLIIENNNTCNWVRSFNREVDVFVSVQNLTEIEYRGSGDIISTNTLEGDSLVLNIWEGAGKVDLDINMQRNYIYFHIGTADVYYKGFTHLSYITAASFGPVDAREMSTVYTYMENKGSNNCYVKTTLHLGATISSIGNIYYKGDPDINLNDYGDGELIKLD